MTTATIATTNSAGSEGESTSKQSLRVSIQGYAGAFHEVAARQFFKDREVEIVAAHTFEDVIDQLLAGKSDTALMAIENTLAGSLMGNYELLNSHELRITSEVYLRIKLNLMALPGSRLEDLREIYSHPIALAQCRRFFRDYPEVRLIEAADTALSACHVRDSGDASRGAVAATSAAELYGLEILAAGIETNPLNHTRFLVLNRDKYSGQDSGNKVSLSFTTSHEAGCLYQVLAILAAYKINLTKIQSRPIIGKPWEYRFFVDFIAAGAIGWEQALESIRPITKELKVLGVYQEGEKP